MLLQRFEAWLSVLVRSTLAAVLWHAALASALLTIAAANLKILTAFTGVGCLFLDTDNSLSGGTLTHDGNRAERTGLGGSTLDLADTSTLEIYVFAPTPVSQSHCFSEARVAGPRRIRTSSSAVKDRPFRSFLC